ncbi:hypothetical protein O0L34_g19453 [Tuta absoluta]|nr:hypothetical protein O0L34_g19453 [Tuta absoluta]
MSLSSELQLLLEKMTDRIEEKLDIKLKLQADIISDKITKTVLTKVEEKLQPLVEENAKLKADMQKLNRKLEYLDTNERRNNIIIHGLAEQNDESQQQLRALVSSTIEETGVKLKEEEMDRIQRLGKKNKENGKIRPILVTTTTL